MIFLTAIVLVTFAMCIGAIYRAIDIMSRGLDPLVVGRFLLNNIPYTLSYSVPISSLFATLLLFGRLSSDSEVAAMKSGGMSLWQIGSPLLLIALGLSAFCLYNNFYVYPKTEYENRQLIKGLGVEDPLKLLEEGKFIREFPGYMIYIGKKHGNQVKDLVVYELNKDSGEVTSTLRASSGTLSMDSGKEILTLDLEDVRMEVEQGKGTENTHYINVRHMPIRLDIAELTTRKKVSRKMKNMTATELFYQIRNAEIIHPLLTAKDAALVRCKQRVHLHGRICLAVAPAAFVLIAIPLGITSHRRESAVGMMMSLGIMFLFYLFIIVADTLDTKPSLYPWLIPWVAIIGTQIAGIVLMRRAD